MKILIIEDDGAIAEVERDFLEINGFEAVIEQDGKKGMEKALTGECSLILLDLMLPGKSGYEICKAIREKTDIPILMVTARIEDIDKVRGLGLGADDYIEKPFSPTELVARVKAHIARYERLTKRGSPDPGAPPEINTGWLVLNAGARRARVSGREINLTNKEYELLYFLASNPEIVFSRERIYRRIWGENRYGDLKTVTVHIKRLRKKIEGDPVNPAHIQTAWGAGYRFVP
jgi:DNA-binding response OmpR family regulator